MIRCSLLAILCSAVITVGACSGRAAEPPAGEDGSQTVRFRRVLVPAASREDWPLGQQKYLPIAPDEFEKLLAASAAPETVPNRSAVAPRISHAEYTAHLIGNRLTEGHATLWVEHASETRALLPLDPCTVAVGRAVWAGEEPRPAILGLGVGGYLDLLVEQPGPLEMDWSLAGQRDSAGVLVFTLRLPACPINRLLIETREDVELLVDHGAVFDLGRGENGVRSWRIELGNRFETELRVAPRGSGSSRQGLALLREHTGYDVSLQGIEVSAEWNLEIHHEPISEIRFQLEDGFQLATAKLGETAVPWTVTAGETGEPSSVVLRLPEPVQGTGLVLRLGLLAGLAADGACRLPRIRPEGIFWQEGSATLFVRAPLVLERITPMGCRQTGMESVTSPYAGESLQFQLYHPDATAELELGEPKHRLAVVSGTSVQWGEEELRATVRADIRLTAGTRFRLDAAVEPRWMVETVESVPADMVDEWSVVKDKQGDRRLMVQLARSLAPERPIRLSIGARRLGASLGDAMEIDDLCPLRFSTNDPSRRLVGLRTSDAYEVEFLGNPAFPVVSRQSLSPSEVELLDADESMALISLDRDAGNLQVRLMPQRPRFTAQVDVEVWLNGRTVEERYRLQCEPETARLDRVVVWLSQRRESPLNWILETESAIRVSSRRWTSDEQLAAGLSTEGEVWEIQINPPAVESLVLTASRESPFGERMIPSLASVPDAETQTGRLAIRAIPGEAVRIENVRLRPTPSEPLPADRFTTMLAAYRYDPWREVGRLGEPGLTVAAHATEQALPAMIWNATLDSRYDADGAGTHVAVFFLENLGLDALRVRLPGEAQTGGPVEVRVDRQRVTGSVTHGATAAKAEPPDSKNASAGSSRDKQLQIALPTGIKYPTVTITFTSRQGALPLVGTLKAPWPEADATVLNRCWSVWLPPEYAAYGQPCNARFAVPSCEWNKRLLGPLGRGAGQPVFQPFDMDHWFGLFGDLDRRHAAQQQAAHWISQTTASAESPEAPTDSKAPVTLKSLLSQPLPASAKSQVLVDWRALARCGITSGTVLADSPQTSAETSHPGLPAQSGLAVVVSPHVILLTTQTRAAQLRPHLEPSSTLNLWSVCSRPFAERLAHASKSSDDVYFVPAARWLEEPDVPGSPWQRESVAGYEMGNSFGWQMVGPIGGSAPNTVRYYHRSSLRLAGSIAFLIAVSAGWRLAKTRTMALLVVACCAGLAALWLPEPFVYTASGIVLGALFCLAFRLVHRQKVPDVHGRPIGKAVITPPSTIAMAVPWGLVLLVAAFSTGFCSAASGEASGEQTHSPMYRVFIPVGEDKKPVGDKYYLPEPLFAELHRLAAARRDAPQGWLLGKAVYRGELTREPVGERFAVGQMRAQFDLHVFSPSTRVRVPLERNEANLAPDGVVLDGRPIQVEWSEDNRALVFEVAEPGQYQLELRMRPRMRAESPAGFDLSIPALPAAQLELGLPSGVPAVEAPTACGDVRREESPARIIAELGPAERISVRWQSGNVAAGNGPAIDVEELLWMKVQPGSVLIEAKWKLAIVEGQVRQFRLAVDPRMRLLPLEGDRSPTVQTSASDTELLRVALEWPEPLPDKTVVTARFLLTGTSGVGNLRMPQIDLLDGRVTKRWVAVSVSEALQFERSGGETLTAAPAPEFVSAWGPTEAVPSFVFRTTSGEPDWTLATRPREPQMSIEPSLTLRFAKYGTDVEYAAKLDTNGGYGFYYRIAAPTTLEVSQVSLLSEGVDRAIRWSQDLSGGIGLFLAGPVSGPQQLTVRGRLPAVLGEPVPLPTFDLEGAQSAASVLRLSRRPGVLVELRDEKGLSPVTPAVGDTADAADWIPVGSYRAAAGSEPAGTLLTVVNEPEVAGKEILRLSVEEGAWHARWECRFEVTGGLLEELTLEAPESWGKPLETSNGAQVRLATTRGTRCELALRPEHPAKDRWWAWVSGKLQLGAGQRISVPDIGAKGTHNVARYVILPRRVDDRPVDWQVQGLQHVPLAEVAPELSPERSSLAAFRVVGRPFTAELPELSVAWGEGSVYLADYAVQWRPDRCVAGVARFDIEPGTQRVCRIRFPEGARPLLIEADGRQVPWTGLPDSGTLEVPLGPPGIPQRVEIVFEAPPVRTVHNTVRLAAPFVVDLPVVRSVWTVAAPVGQLAGLSGTPHDTTAGQIALARLESLGALIDHATSLAGADATDTTDWYRPWLQRWIAARAVAEVAIEHIRDEATRETAKEHLDGLTKRHTEIVGRLSDSAAMQTAPNVAESDHVDVRYAGLFQGQSLLYHLADGQASDIAIAPAPEPSSSVWSRVMAAVGWLALSILFAVGLRRGTLIESFQRWPQAVGMIVGLLWWLWLSPSLLGLVLVVACLASSLRTGWRSISRPPTDNSAVSISYR